MGNVVPIAETKTDAPEFEDFWRMYPRKVEKAHGRKMWNRLTSEEKKAAVLALPLHVRHWNGKELEFIPHAGSWLNPVEGRRWEDELQTGIVTVDQTCAKCGGSLAAGFVKRREGPCCQICEDKR